MTPGLLHEAAAWRLLGLLLERPRAGWRDEVAALGREVPDERLRAAAREATGAGEGAYLALLGPGGLVSPREVTYRPFEDPGRVLADLRTAYEVFAFHPRAEEPIDHVAVEVGFVGYLVLKEAFAAARGEGEAAATSGEARTAFLETHLGAVAGPLAERLAGAGPSWLATAATLLAARVPDRRAATLAAPELPDGCGACPGAGS